MKDYEWYVTMDYVTTSPVKIKEKYKSSVLNRDNENFITKHPLNFVICNVWHWMNNEEEIMKWLDENTVNGRKTHMGMTLTFANEEEAMWFKLRWD